jgi:epoxyqueuosine reductase
VVRPTYLALKEYALSLGFNQVELIPIPSLQEEGLHLQHWLQQGMHATMGWMYDHLDKRLNPASLMPNTQSVLCVTHNYYPGPLEGAVKIARYAQGDDYHDVLKAKLKQILGWLKAQDPSIEGRPLVDSAPILEKALARHAGLGWQGKNSNLISQRHGSWFFIGELLLNTTFVGQPTLPEPVPFSCGSCTRCISACPTQAIVADGVVDATKCISYWTIEHKTEAIPAEIQQRLSGWLFGCDICQEVCPWNQKFQQVTEEPRFLPRPWNARPQLKDIALMTAGQFKTRYRKSPLKRRKLEGLLRNKTWLETI